MSDAEDDFMCEDEEDYGLVSVYSNSIVIGFNRNLTLYQEFIYTYCKYFMQRG